MVSCVIFLWLVEVGPFPLLCVVRPFSLLPIFATIYSYPGPLFCLVTAMPREMGTTATEPRPDTRRQPPTGGRGQSAAPRSRESGDRARRQGGHSPRLRTPRPNRLDGDRPPQVAARRFGFAWQRGSARKNQKKKNQIKNHRADRGEINPGPHLRTNIGPHQPTVTDDRFRDPRRLPPRKRGAGRPKPLYDRVALYTSVAMAWEEQWWRFRGRPATGGGPYDGCFSHPFTTHRLFLTLMSPRIEWVLHRSAAWPRGANDGCFGHPAA